MTSDANPVSIANMSAAQDDKRGEGNRFSQSRSCGPAMQPGKWRGPSPMHLGEKPNPRAFRPSVPKSKYCNVMGEYRIVMCMRGDQSLARLSEAFELVEFSAVVCWHSYCGQWDMPETHGGSDPQEVSLTTDRSGHG